MRRSSNSSTTGVLDDSPSEHEVASAEENGDIEDDLPMKRSEASPFKTWKGLQRITASEWDERNAQQYTG